MTKRFATVDDYNQDRAFVYALFTVNASGLEVSDFRPIKIRHDPKDGTYRINPYGRIENTELGVLHIMARSEYTCSGVIIDYADNADLIESVAKVGMQEIRDKMVTRMKAELQKLSSAQISIAGVVCP